MFHVKIRHNIFHRAVRTGLMCYCSECHCDKFTKQSLPNAEILATPTGHTLEVRVSTF